MTPELAQAFDDFLMPAGDVPGAPDQAARFLKSLAHRDRLKILCSLAEQERSAGEIEAAVGGSQSAVSQHLARLREDGILSARRDGRRIVYSIADPTVLGVIEVLYGRFCAVGDG